MIAHNFMGIFVFSNVHFCGREQCYEGESTYHDKNRNRNRFDVIKQYSLIVKNHDEVQQKSFIR